jgi:DNA-binding response OmpR family regulator
MVLGAEHLFGDRTQKNWAGISAVVKAIEQVRQHRSTPIIVLSGSQASADELLRTGADVVLSSPFNADQFKAEVRSLLELNSPAEPAVAGGWSAIGSFLRGFQKAKA